jgi:hypothetical protein
MKIWNILPIFFIYSSFASSRLLQPKSSPLSFLNGNWFQIYSSKYVQESTEIDWNCIDVVVSTNNNNVNILKNAMIHNHKETGFVQNRTYELSNVNNTLLLTPLAISSSVIPNLQLKHIDDNYVILTGLDYLTMYVWTRNYSDFFSNNNNEALQLLRNFNYTTYYKYPHLSYNDYCF